MPGTVLITGGTGYIGSFTALALLEAGYKVILVDNLANSYEEVPNRIRAICGKEAKLEKVDITDEKKLDEVFEKYEGVISSVIHFAALKAVGESGEIPLEYYRVNVGGTISLLRCMTRHNVKTIVFSSSATVYGDATLHKDMIPIPEHCPLAPTNPYGRTKMTNELIITDHCHANPDWNGALLRYFNPAGAHPSGIMGEDPKGVPFNLLPLLGQVAAGSRKNIHVFGTDYSSRDGTAIRDYIHVLDLAQGHLAALRYLEKQEKPIGCRAWNLGTGKGSTVFEIIVAFSKAANKELPYEIHPRRPGDVLDLTALPTRANEELNWKAERDIQSACQDLYKWVENNKDGYKQDFSTDLLVEWLESVGRFGLIEWLKSEGIIGNRKEDGEKARKLEGKVE